MAEFLTTWAGSVWKMLLDSAFLFLVGVTLAGILWLVLNARTMQRLAGGSPAAGVLKAALVGLPLPLCSCSVVPVATQLRRAGFSRAGTMAFLVSTPESGVDSILMTYAMTGPFLTIARPVAAYFSAIATGLTEAWGFPEKRQAVRIEMAAEADACCAGDCCCEKPEQVEIKQDRPGIVVRLWAGIKYAYTDLVADLAPYMFIGFVLAGLIAAVVGEAGAHLPDNMTSGWVAYAWAIAIGVPTYVCATSSTPLAAVLLASGVAPGPILVFLLVGPATNVASIAMLKRVLGGWATARYVLVVVLTAIVAGVVADWAWGAVGATVRMSGGMEHGERYGVVSVASAVFLSVLILYYTGRKYWRSLTRRFKWQERPNAA